jgi:hypothetical protein
MRPPRFSADCVSPVIEFFRTSSPRASAIAIVEPSSSTPKLTSGPGAVTDLGCGHNDSPSKGTRWIEIWPTPVSQASVLPSADNIHCAGFGPS